MAQKRRRPQQPRRRPRRRWLPATPAVPTVAVIREGDVATVWVEPEPMLFKRRVVEIGMQQNGLTQIRGGLDIGELVVARGAIFVDNEWRQ